MYIAKQTVDGTLHNVSVTAMSLTQKIILFMEQKPYGTLPEDLLDLCPVIIAGIPYTSSARWSLGWRAESYQLTTLSHTPLVF